MHDPRALGSTRTGPHDGRLIVLVEDDDGLRDAIGRVLRAAGFEAHAYATAEAALAGEAPHQPDGLVLDLNLPAMSGLDLLERLRRRGVQAPAIAITASDSRRVRAEVHRHGIEHLLVKPFGGGTLVRLLDRVLRPHPCGGPSG